MSGRFPRFYDPEIGTFLTHDAAREDVNPYTYVRWNPVTRVDPTGLMSKGPADDFEDFDDSDDSAPDSGREQVAAAPAAALGLAPGAAAVALEAAKAIGAAIVGIAGAIGISKAVGNDSGESDSSGASESGADSAKSRSKPPGPDPAAEGRPHSIIERPGKQGQYTTHDSDGKTKIKQYRGDGKGHGKGERGIPRPNIKEYGTNIAPGGREYLDKGRVRPPRQDEIPGG